MGAQKLKHFEEKSLSDIERIELLFLQGHCKSILQPSSNPTDRTTNGCEPFLAAGYALLGENSKATEILNAFRFRIKIPSTNPYYRMAFDCADAFLLLEKQELGAPLDMILEKQVSGSIANPLHVIAAYARLAQYEAALPQDQAHRLQQLKSAGKALLLVAKTPLYQGHSDVIHAAILRMTGRPEKAELRLGKAMQIAAACESPWIHFEGLRQQAVLSKDNQNTQFALQQARFAYYLAYDQGWTNRAQKVLADFSLTALVPPQGKAYIPETSDPVTSDKHRSALMQFGSALSPSSGLEECKSIALREILKLLNAERAFLFLVNSYDQLELSLGMGFDGKQLNQLEDFGHSAIQKVRIHKEPTLDTNTHSIVAAPLMMQGSVVGIVYVDLKVSRGLFSDEDVEFLMAIANHLSVSLEAAKTAQLTIERKALETDLALASTVQKLLLPEKDGFESKTLYAKSFYQAASQTGGDWWYHHADETGHTVLMADVTGHGAGSAMVSAVALSIYRTLIRTAPAASLPENIEELHKGLSQMVRGHYWMTLAALWISADGRTLSGWAAGAPQIYILSEDGSIEVLAEKSSPLGGDNFKLGELHHPLQRNDRIFIFTDGVVENHPANGQRWGERQLLALLKKTKSLSPDHARNEIAMTLLQMQDGKPREDDTTFLIIDVIV